MKSMEIQNRCSNKLYQLLIFLTIFTLALSYRALSYLSGPTFPRLKPKSLFSNSAVYGSNFPRPFPGNSYKELSKVYEGKNLEFWFPSESERQRTLNNGDYDPDNPILIDVDVYYPQRASKPKIFVTIPRFGGGVPYSLAYLTDVMKPNGSEFRPYPNYEVHSSHGQDCNGLTSVFRVHIDECGQMWVLDSGEIEFKQHCPPQVVVIDLNTDRIVHRYRLSEKLYKPTISRFVTPVVDICDPPPVGSCKQAFVYMADPTGLGFVVYDVARGDAWRIENKYTYPDPSFGTHTIAGESFELLDGVFGFAITPRGLGLRRMLFFHSLASDLEVAIPLDVVNNSTNWQNGIASSLDEFIPLGRRGVQCAVPAMTPHGFLLCGFYDPIAIVGWNIRTAYTPENRIVMAENPYTLQFVSGLKVIKNPFGKYEVWMASNRLQKSFTDTMDFKEINYRIQVCGLDELLIGKPCRNFI